MLSGRARNPLIFCLTFSCILSVCTAQKAPAAQTQTLFEFHSGFWINLHHFLYLEALAQQPQGRHPATVSDADAAALKSLSPEELSAWNSAVSYYSSSMIQRDLLFDRGMQEIKNALEDSELAPELTNTDIPPALRDTLSKVAPIYRKHLWQHHDAENREWIANLEPLVAKYGEKLRDSLVKIYEMPWPGQPVRVDVTIYGGPVGAYTTIEPTRPTVSSTNASYQGQWELEMVFHETSHGMIQKVHDALQAADANVHTTNGAAHSATLWHAILFYTAGELVAEQIPGYVPYADKNGLWDRAWPEPNRTLIVQDWKPHMDGAVSIPAAITKLVNDLAASPSHH
jgi:hypothetical protein